MKKTLKGFVVGFIMASLLTSTIVYGAGSYVTKNLYYNSIKLVVDGRPYTPKDVSGNIVEPFIIDGTTYLPVRAVAAALGKDVSWDGSTSTVYIGKDNTETSFVKVVPPYETNNCKVIDAVTMAGNKYYNVIRYNANTSYSLHNLNGQYTQITGYLGHIDGEGTQKGTMTFYGDGNIIKSIDINAEQLPQNITIDVTGVLQLKIEFATHSFYTAAYAFSGEIK